MSRDEPRRRLQTSLWELAEQAIQAPTREEIDSRVCEGLQSRDRFDSVWVCDTSPDPKPRIAVGRGLGEINRLHEAFGELETTPPWTRAVETSEAVARSVPASVWPGDHSLGCVPLQHQRINYGVLVVGSQTRSEREIERDMESLYKFGQVVGHALATTEMQTHGEIFRQAVEQAEPAFAILGDDGTVEYANAGFKSTFGHSKSDAIGSTLHDLVEGIPRGLISDVRTGSPWHDELVCYRRDGREIHVDVSVAAVPIEGGTRRKYVATATDITPIWERQQRLQVLNRVLRHNLRNDLDVIQSHIELAAVSANQPPERHLETAMEATRELLSTAETSRNVQTTLSNAEIREQELVTVLQRVLDRVEQEYPDRDVQVSMPEALPFFADVGLEDALWELLENACVHGDDPIEVAANADDGWVEIEITDRGPGIPDHELDVIESGEETPLEHGSGLGLWFAQWVIRTSRGQLAFEINGGTTVKVSVPGIEG